MSDYCAIDMNHFIYIFIIINWVSGYLINTDPEDDLQQYYCGSNNLTFYNHTPFSYVIEESDLCFGEVFLLTYVQSSSKNFEKRMVIRETFGSLRFIDNNAVRLLFIVGRPQDSKIQRLIEKESKSYRDIVQADFKDTYYNLTLKHIVALHWINRFCRHAQFISKTDDDTFVNMFLLTSHLREKFNSKEKFILGQISYNEKPIREDFYKWSVSFEMYPENKYPPFTKGFAYVLSQSAIKPLLVCSYYRRYFFIDDIFMTGLVSSMANVTLVDFNRFYGHRWLYNENITMDMMENLFIVSQTEYHPDKWRDLWQAVLKTEL